MKKKGEEKHITNHDRIKYRKYIAIGVVVLLFILSYQIIKPYIVVIVSSFVLAFLCKPVFDFLSKKLNKKLSAIICLILISLIFLAPLAFIVPHLSAQASSLVKNSDVVGFVSKIKNISFLNNIDIDWSSIINRVGMFLFSIIGTFVTQIPSIILSVIILVISFFYILVEWEYVQKQVIKFIPFQNKEKIISELSSATKGIVFGSFLIAIIEFIISAVGLYIAGIKYYLLLSFVIAILAFIPGIGPAFVNVPILIYSALYGNWYAFIVVFITWTIISIGVDTMFKSQVLKHTSSIHPIVVILGMIGGISMFGIFGFIIGPLMLAYTLKIIEEI